MQREETVWRSRTSAPIAERTCVYAPARYCESCRVVIVPVPEIETFSDKAGKWLDKTLGSLGDRIDRAAERREEEKAAREREEKRNKDPWEV